MGQDGLIDTEPPSSQLGEAVVIRRAAARERITETDRAIAVALCRPYIDGAGLPCPASNKAILDELSGSGIYLSLDALRTHLRGLYAKFGVEDGLTGMQKRVRLVEVLRDSAIVPGWGDDDAPLLAQSASVQIPAATVVVQLDESAQVAGAGNTTSRFARSRVLAAVSVLATCTLVLAAVLLAARPSAHERAIHRALTAFTTNHPDLLRDVLAPDIRFTEPWKPGDDRSKPGVASAMLRMRDLRSYFDKEMRYEVDRLHENGDRAEYDVRFTGHQVKPFPDGCWRNDAAGAAIVDGKITSKFEDGEITEIRLDILQSNPVDGPAESPERCVDMGRTLSSGQR